MKFAIIAAAVLLSGCATDTVSFTAERAATLARASHAVACGAVETSHAAGQLTGAKFNKAKDICIQADSVLDGADAALLMGADVIAAQKIKDALSMLSQLKGF